MSVKENVAARREYNAYQARDVNGGLLVRLGFLVPPSHCEELVDRVKVVLGVSWWGGLEKRSDVVGLGHYHGTYTEQLDVVENMIVE